MIRLLFDENFNHRILRGLERRITDLDALTVQAAGLGGADDPRLLEWAAINNRILITHDVNTVVDFANERIRAGETCNGVVIVPKQMSVGQAIDEITILNECATGDEFVDQILFLPL